MFYNKRVKILVVITGLLMLICILAGPALFWLTSICVKHSLQIHRNRTASRKALLKEELMAEQIAQKVGQSDSAGTSE